MIQKATLGTSSRRPRSQSVLRCHAVSVWQEVRFGARHGYVCHLSWRQMKEHSMQCGTPQFFRISRFGGSTFPALTSSRSCIWNAPSRLHPINFMTRIQPQIPGQTHELLRERPPTRHARACLASSPKCSNSRAQQ